MSAQSIISRYNHMNGNAVSGATLREFHDSIQKYLDRSGSGPFTHSINGIRKRLAAVLNSVKTTDVVEVRVKLIDTDEQIAGYQVPVKVVKKKKSVSIPEQHRKKIEAKNKQMPKPIRDIMNGCDEDLLHGLENIQDDAEYKGEPLGAIGDTTYKVITDKILSLIEKDGLIWRKPWNQDHQGKESHAHNYVTKSYYRGTNFYLNYLLLSDFKAPYYLTFRQVDQLGGKVKDGQKGWPVIYFKWLYKKSNNGLVDEKEAVANGKVKPGYDKFPALFYYTVFNAEQCEGLKLKPYKAVKLTAKEKIESCETIVAAMPQKPSITNARGDRADYMPSHDSITMPLMEQFKIDQEYYSTLFHEMVHSTGHPKRLDRDLTGRFGNKKYAFEELIAELGASYLCGESGIFYFTMKNTAAYIKSWSKKLREEMAADSKFFLKAAAAAEKASEFILNRLPVKAEKPKQVAKVDAKEVAEVAGIAKPETSNRKPATKLHGVVDASTLAGISYSTFDIAPEWKKEFHKINSDSVLMIWGKPGSGKTVKLLKLAQHLSMDLKKKVLYIAEEEYGRSTLADKLTDHKIGNANLSFAPDLNEGIVNSFDAIFLDSVNSMHLSPADVKNLIRKHPGKLWVLIVQTTKEGDFRGGRDWEHLVDIAGEVVNRKMILRKNRLDPNNKAKADKLLVDEIVTEKKQAQEIKDLVKQKIEGEQKQQAA